MTLDGSMDSNSISSESTQGDELQEVRTLFVSGLPMDTKPREIYLMFRGCKGFQTSSLKLTGKEGKKATPVAFVTFENREQAEISKSELQGVRFDPDLPTTIRIEFAKANTKVTRPTNTKPISMIIPHGTPGIPSPPYPTFDLTTGMFTTTNAQWPQQGTNFTDINGNHITALPQHLHPGITTLPIAHSPLMLAPVSIPSQSHSIIPNHMIAAPTQDLTPRCNTLFVANLGHNATETELRNIFKTIPKFDRLRMLRNNKTQPVAFVKYYDEEAAALAKRTFNGILLSGNTCIGGGIRIEYARNGMGECGRNRFNPTIHTET